MIGRPKLPLTVTDEEREGLLRMAGCGSLPVSRRRRAAIVLACAKGADNLTVARQVGCEAHTVSMWRRRFLEDRIRGLED